MGAQDQDKNLLFCFISLLLFFSCQATHNITLSQWLSQNQTLISQNQIFELGFFSPINSTNQYVGIWYKQISPRKVVWVANRDNPLTFSPASLRMKSNGNLELLDGKKNSFWSTNISVPSNGSVAVLSIDGNLIIRDSISEEKLWQSFDHPCDIILPSTVLAFSYKTGERRVWASWKSSTDPSTGNFSIEIAQKRTPEAVIWNGKNLYWRSGPWDKTKFIGIPDMDASYLNAFTISEDVDLGAVYASFYKYNTSAIAHMHITPEGVVKVMHYDNDKGQWFNSWRAPKTSCDVYGACGPYGVCKISESPICTCLKGFEPKSQEEWNRGNWTRGCVRQSNLVCQKNTSRLVGSDKGKNDGFLKKGMMKLPDFYEHVQLREAEDCRSWCLNNCSCLAYSYVNGIGCLIWSRELIDLQELLSAGENLYVRLAQAELGGGKKIRKIFTILGVSISASVILGGILYRVYKWRSLNQKGISSQYLKQYDPSELPIFDLDTILFATNNFNATNKLGQGGFGSVYKGKLQDGTEIAVKRLSSSSEQGTEEFKNEMILISKLQHRNLVKLYGYCIEEEERLLIYEYMPNKSLDTFLFDPQRREELNWTRRFRIIHGIAKGILYLHCDSSLRVIHRDLKVSNILLDDKMNPKISDFGLARIFHGTIVLVNTQRVVGTLGYMSPEYAMSGIFSEKSDVFSYGVLLLEIISGQKNTNFRYNDQHLSLIAYTWKLWSEERAIELMDETLVNSYSTTEVMRCIHVGLLCVQDHPIDRPNMPDVVFMLSNETDRPLPKQPLFTLQTLPRHDFQMQGQDRYFSINGVSMTMIHGR